jgi:dCMP deaminase
MRPNVDEYFLQMASLVAQRSTCIRRSVGCVLTDIKSFVLATGYNGVASGLPHCNFHDPSAEVGYPYACPGAFEKSGTNLHACHAIHAENNALIQCTRPQDIKTCYVTASPCVTCTRMLLNTSCERIVFLEEYPHTESKQLWISQNRQWIHYSHDQTGVQK